MATTTQNLGLTKPAASEAADISVLNSNFDLIDALGGHGLGGAKKITDDIDTIVKPGWYWISASSSITIGGFSSADWYIRVDAYSSGTSYCVQHLYPLSSHKVELVRYKVKGTWGDAEWVNPPMILGTEYRTTERWQGSAVYVKAINFGALPNATYKAVAHGVENFKKAIRCELINVNSAIMLTNHVGVTQIDAGTTNFQITTGRDMSTHQAYAVMWYTKS